MRHHLNVRGTASGYTGYDNTVRSLVLALGRIGVEVGLADFTSWSNMVLPQDKREFAPPGPLALETSPLVVQFCLPFQVEPFPACRTINFTMFELDRVPRFWLEHNLHHDHVVVPEESSRQAWLVEGFPPERISICSLGVDCERFHPGHEPLALGAARSRAVADHRVRILNVSGVQPRKNLLALLRAWLEATRRDDDAILILKLSFSGLDGVRLMRNLHFLERQLGRSREDAAPIRFVDAVLTDSEMPRLYAAATHYWSMSHGEGWDQPMTEAAASGLRLVAPDHTAYRAYLDPGIATLLPCRTEPATRIDLDVADPGEFRACFTMDPLWFEPDQRAAIEAIRAAIEQRDAPKESARQRMLALSWEASARSLWTIAQRVLADSDQATGSGRRSSPFRSELRIPCVPGLRLLTREDDVVIGSAIRVDGFWEPLETAMLLHCVEAGDTVVDVGAHVGYFTVLASRLVGPAGLVLAFEPEPGNFALLEANCALNDCRNVRLESCALADHEGKAQLAVSLTNTGDHRLDLGGTGAGQVVRVQRFDDCVSPEAAVDFVKIDAQGCELAVLDGMHATIRRNAARLIALVEVTPNLSERAGRPLPRLRELLRHHGATAHRLVQEGDTLQLSALDDAALADFWSDMLRCSRDDAGQNLVLFFSPAARDRFVHRMTAGLGVRFRAQERAS